MLSSSLDNKNYKKLSPAITASEEYTIDLDELLLADQQIQQQKQQSSHNQYHHPHQQQQEQEKHKHHSTTSDNSHTKTNNNNNNNFNNISTNRHTPCPRLCGATFCQGGYGSGLIIFHNGKIIKQRWLSHKNQEQQEQEHHHKNRSLASNVIQRSSQIEQQQQKMRSVINSTGTSYATPRTMYDYMHVTSNKFYTDQQQQNKPHSSVVIYTNRHDHLYMSKKSTQLQRQYQQQRLQQKVVSNCTITATTNTNTSNGNKRKKKKDSIASKDYNNAIKNNANVHSVNTTSSTANIEDVKDGNNGDGSDKQCIIS